MRDHLREAKLLRQKIRYALAREEARALKITTRRYLRLRREVRAEMRIRECEELMNCVAKVYSRRLKRDTTVPLLR